MPELTLSPPPWSRPNVAGRIVELSGAGDGAPLTTAMKLVLDAQRRGETVAWVTTTESSFFPPDAAAAGIDLEALAVLRLPVPRVLTHAAERLVRSGAFGLVVVDLGADATGGDVPLALLTRLLGLVEKHDAAVLFLTEKTETAPSLGSLVSLRVSTHRERIKDGEFSLEIRSLRDRRRPAGWKEREVRYGPDGLR